MRISVFILAVSLMLAGCATPIDQAYIAKMNGYVGKTEGEMIAAMGVPDKSYQLDSGAKVMTYAHASQRVFDNPPTTCAGNAGTPFVFGNCYNPPIQSVTYYCEYNFNIWRGHVTSWSQNGNDCPRIK